MAIKNYSETNNRNMNYKVLENFGKLDKDSDAAYVKELRLVSWNGAEPKYSIHPWKVEEDGTERCRSGLTFTASELQGLLELLKKLDGNEDE